MEIVELIQLFRWITLTRAILIAVFLWTQTPKKEKEWTECMPLGYQPVACKIKITYDRSWERGIEYPYLRLVCCVGCLGEGNLTVPDKFTLKEADLFEQGWGLDGNGRPLCPEHRPYLTMAQLIEEKAEIER